jgi:hypothetical protein
MILFLIFYNQGPTAAKKCRLVVSFFSIVCCCPAWDSCRRRIGHCHCLQYWNLHIDLLQIDHLQKWHQVHYYHYYYFQKLVLPH